MREFRKVRVRGKVMPRKGKFQHDIPQSLKIIALERLDWDGIGGGARKIGNEGKRHSDPQKVERPVLGGGGGLCGTSILTGQG